MTPELYMKWIDRTEISRPMQMIILTNINYNYAIFLGEMIANEGHKLNTHALLVIKSEIEGTRLQAKIYRLSIEN